MRHERDGEGLAVTGRITGIQETLEKAGVGTLLAF